MRGRECSFKCCGVLDKSYPHARREGLVTLSCAGIPANLVADERLLKWVFYRLHYPYEAVYWLYTTRRSQVVNRRVVPQNYRMAQPTKWMPAILDYMRKGSNISTVVLAHNPSSDSS